MYDERVMLVIAAHPDDELLGCGGTIAKVSATQEVRIVILGEGISSRQASASDTDVSTIQRLHENARDVGRLLGARSVDIEGLPDNRFDELPLLDVVKRVESYIDRFKPWTIYTHHPGDLNIDHLVTFRAVMTAARPVAGCPVKEIYTFEVASSTEWAFQQFQPSFKPNVFVDISASIETKVRGMQLYESEARTFPHPRSGEALKIQAQHWGTVVGMRHAEAFELVRALWT